MKRVFGLFAVISLILSIGLVVYLILFPLFALVYTPYLVLSTALTLTFSTAYFYKLNDVDSRFLSLLIYAIAFLPSLIPLIACFDPDFMETYWRNYISLTFLQLGVGLLSASFFFRKPGVNFVNVCSALSAMLLFLFGILVMLDAGVLRSFPFLISSGAIITVLFVIALTRRLSEAKSF